MYKNYGSLELVLVYPHKELIMHILSMLGNGAMVVQLVLYSVSICNLLSIWIHPAYISTFYSDSKELVLVSNQKKEKKATKKLGSDSNLQVLSLGNCFLSVVEMFWGQKASI